jgi:hypothetical protein
MAVTIKPYRTKTEYTAGKDSTGSKVLGVLGAVGGGIVGGIAGGPAGAIAGASAGSSLGGTLGGMVDPAKAATQSGGEQVGGVESADQNAMERRLGKSQQDRLAVLRQSEAALAQLPKELREEYAAPIVAATMQEEKRRAMGMG